MLAVRHCLGGLEGSKPGQPPGSSLSRDLIPFRPLAFSHSAEVLSKSGNLMVRGASCLGGLGKRLMNGPLAISVDIYMQFKNFPYTITLQSSEVLPHTSPRPLTTWRFLKHSQVA